MKLESIIVSIVIQYGNGPSCFSEMKGKQTKLIFQMFDHFDDKKTCNLLPNRSLFRFT